MTRFFFIAFALLTTLLLSAPALAITQVDSDEVTASDAKGQQLGDLAHHIVSATRTAPAAAEAQVEATREEEASDAPVVTRGLFALGAQGETRAPLGTGLPATIAIFALVGVMFVLPRRQFAG